ncbi:protein DMR6-LIKE OXYGENASE 2-like isoform X2 [Salvia miltiorrhiza]|uniref:protein DMR6-LIKE OXYGENASE 2-like isoform X2 n=1 Tax=Salvia miltiorrhiza TaxID=226208 RepID=UPI0025ACCDEC|nr:protein DMR6-LIKE OXYGENASE 2-like isoform X2 [Salvia miltiorrhiza]
MSWQNRHSSDQTISAMGEVDPDFIQPLEHQPKPESVEARGIPFINLSPLNSQEPDAAALDHLVSEIGDACKIWGFFQIINHGVPSRVRQRIEKASKEFFALPKEEKRKASRDEANLFGYSDFEITKSVRDWKEIFDCTIENPTVIYASDEPDDKELKELTSQWPQYPPNLREICQEYAAEMQKLTHKLLELIALSLGLKKDRFHGFFKEQTSFMRLNYYPSCPAPQLALGLGRHKDAGAMTVLAQDDVGGLEVKRKPDGEWIFVKPMPDAYIVNVGDLIQVWSNDKYESVEHRVTVNSEKERFSIPFFLNPSHYVWVEPLHELVDEENPSKYKGYSWGKFYATRKLSNFKKLTSENIQVHHFKV